MMEQSSESLRTAASASGNRPRRVYITAAEVSGDKHAAQLIRALQAIDPTVIVEGLGGPEMAAAGATIHVDTVAGAAMGIKGIMRAREIHGWRNDARRHFDSNRPDLWIGVDSPGMNIHFARVAKERGVPTLQFVAPQLWAWAPWRIKGWRKYADRIACIMPFEESYFRERGVNATFIGHPLFDELPSHRARPPGPHFPDAPPVVGLLPGSRRSIASGNFPRQLEVGASLLRHFPEIRFHVPTTLATDPVVRAAVAAGPLPAERINVELDAFDRLVPQCDFCLTVSGTATLHVASFGVPMIVVYQGSRLLWNLVGRWVIRTRTFAMVNLLADPTPLVPDPQGKRHVVPEIVPWCGPTEPVAEMARELLSAPGLLAERRRRLTELVDRLDHPGASDAAAKIAWEMMLGAPALSSNGR